MQNKYKVSYRKDCEKIKRRRQRAVFIISAIVIIVITVLVIGVYALLNKTQKTNNDDLINDIENNISINDSIDNNYDNHENNIADEDNTVDENNTADERPVIDIDSLNFHIKNDFEYGAAVAESEAVINEYFDDAVFIGNSQIEGISIYSSMKNTTVFAGKGIMVDTIFTKEAVKAEDSKRITIMDALAKEQFGKIYIMLGANELGWAFDYLFIEQYGRVIDEIKRLQPDAKIYVNAVMPVSKEKSDKDKIYNNQKIDSYNELILNMTKEKEVYYIDSKEALADEEGNLPEDAGTDGIHLNATYYEKWFNYLKTHTVN